MSFYGRTFIFDDTPSEQYNLYVGELNGAGESTSNASNDVSVLTQKIYRKPIPLLLGVEQTPVLTFPFSAYCPDELTAPSFSDVSSWLWGQQSYKKLRICQNDISDIYFNCFLTAPQIMRVGNIIQSFTTTVLCDSPFAWKQPKTNTYTYTGYSISDTIAFLNESANVGYTYPTTLTIVSNAFGGDITIINETDSLTRSFYISLSANETITMDCDKQIMTSNVTTYPLVNFVDKNWLRFLRGFNTLTVVGNISSLSITIPIAVKLGG